MSQKEKKKELLSLLSLQEKEKRRKKRKTRTTTFFSKKRGGGNDEKRKVISCRKKEDRGGRESKPDLSIPSARGERAERRKKREMWFCTSSARKERGGASVSFCSRRKEGSVREKGVFLRVGPTIGRGEKRKEKIFPVSARFAEKEGEGTEN